MKMELPVTQIKICGLTRMEDAKLAMALGAWALGFIFYSKSPRFVSSTQVKDILAALNLHPNRSSLRATSIRTVGVFVNPSLAELEKAVSESGINTIQLHGNESREFCALVRKNFPQAQITKAFRLDETLTVIDSKNYDYQLIDSHTPDAWGGTGRVADWEKAAKLGGKALILAGGLTPENVAQAIQQVKPFAVDVSSGVESAPGIKSEQKLKDFFKAAKGNVSA
jgi:phosphoribosylanthranilate isomerase